MARVAGIDFGTVRIGVALADTEIGIASPLATHTRQNLEVDTRYFRRLVEQEAIVKFVVGLPVHLDGRESQKSREAREFGLWLAKETGVEVAYFDERFTTAEADQLLALGELTKKKRKARRDQLAAQIMLTAFLESGGRGQESLEGIE
ncbi:MAG: Holliday junction resolvase RuvX [Pirellulales bacterium]